MKVVTYSRVSTETQRDKKTIVSYMNEMREYCKQNNLDIVDEIREEAVSGTTSIYERPGTRKILEYAQDKKIDAVVFPQIDRVSRDEWGLDPMLIEKELAKFDVLVFYVDGTHLQNKLMKMIGGWKAGENRLEFLKKTKRGRDDRFKRKQAWAAARYGYNYVKQEVVINGDTLRGAVWQINQQEAEVVKMIFDWYTRGLGRAKIAKELAKRNIPSREGKLWSGFILIRMLKDKCYTGTAYINKTAMEKGKRINRPKSDWIPFAVPAIIDQQTFAIVQSRIKENTNTRIYDNSPYLLSNRVRCGICGASCTGDTSRSHYKGKVYDKANRYYRCKSHVYIPADMLEKKVWEGIQEILEKPDKLIKMIKVLSENPNREIKLLNEEMGKYQKKLAKIHSQEAACLDLHLEGQVSKPALIEKMNTLSEEKNRVNEYIAALQGKLKQIAEHSKHAKNVYEFCRDWSGRLREMDFENKKQLLSIMQCKVVWLGGDKRLFEVKGAIPDFNKVVSAVSMDAPHSNSNGYVLSPVIGLEFIINLCLKI